MQTNHAKILVLDDDEDILTSVEMYLEDHFEKVMVETNPHYLDRLLQQNDFHVILLDMNFRRGKSDGSEGIFWLEQILQKNPDQVVILMTAFGDIDLAVKGIKLGAFDFILKPWKNAKLLASIISATKYANSKNETIVQKNKTKLLSNEIDKHYQEIIGLSPTIKNILGTIDKVAGTDANILILGENGTGKELIAHEIHKKSLLKDDIFVSVDMGSITESLFESELFGHVRGAFTDAKEDKKGRFELASGGTIFLDEIGNLPYSLQSKLLTVLQNRTVTPVGSSKVIPVDIRLICATNSNLEKLVKEGNFRQDLYYRLNTFEIHIPPLRDRQADIPAIAEYYTNQFCKKYNKPQLIINNKTLKHLTNYSWPGNIRELKNTIERGVILSNNKNLTIDNLGISGFIDLSSTNTLNLEENEKKLIKKALQKSNGNISKAAKELGIDRNALYRRLAKYDL